MHPSMPTRFEGSQSRPRHLGRLPEAVPPILDCFGLLPRMALFKGICGPLVSTMREALGRRFSRRFR
jgi:hypothetical protein